MTDLLFLLLSITGTALVCCGLAATFRKRLRPGLQLNLAGGVLLAAGAAVGRAWPLLAADIVLIIVIAWLLRHTRRRKRALRAYGAKSRARVAALVRKAREAARPRPARRLAPQGG